MLELTSVLWDCERRGLWAGLFPWLHPEGLGLGSVGNQAGPPCPRELQAAGGSVWGDQGDSGREAVSGLALGQAALCGCSLCLSPAPRGTTHSQCLSYSTLPACGAALPWCWWELGGDTAQGWNTGCHQVSLFCCQPLSQWQ